MNKIFIDLGVWSGVSTKLFFDGKLDNIDPTGFVAHGFDPLKIYLKEMKELEGKYPFTFINKAVWTYDGEVEFGEFKNDESSTIKKEKLNYDSAKVVKVPCVDFSAWLGQFQKEDEVFVKMNIEGAEVDILEYLIKTGNIKLIDKLIIENHYNKIGGDYTERMQKLEKVLPIDWKFWRRSE